MEFVEAVVTIDLEGRGIGLVFNLRSELRYAALSYTFDWKLILQNRSLMEDSLYIENTKDRQQCLGMQKITP